MTVYSLPWEVSGFIKPFHNDLGSYTWTACVEKVAQFFNWDITKGSLKASAATTQSTPSTAIARQPSLSASPLQMPVKFWQAGRGYPESQLLRADEALVPFDPLRQPFIDLLNGWIDNPAFPQAIRLVTGAGGLGKTRLAMELCQQRSALAWHCGFLTKEHNEKDMAGIWQQLRSLNQPVLLVMDYAETRQTVLLAFIKAMLQQPGEQVVRVLLLARNGGEWWDNLPSKDAVCERLLAGYATSGPYELPALYLDTESRSAAYRLALSSYAQAIAAEVPSVLPDLSRDHFSKPLYLQMAALLALYGERPATAEGLTKALLNHEQRYWTNALAETDIANTQQAPAAQLLLALATLCGGFATAKQGKPYWDAASDDGLSPAQFSALFNALVPLYPDSKGLQSVQPDLLGEALVAQALFQRQGALVLDAVLNPNAENFAMHHALTVIARLSSHRPELQNQLTEAINRHFCHCIPSLVKVAIETPSHLPDLAEAAFTALPQQIKSQAAGILKPYFEHDSVELGRLAVAVRLFEKDKSEKKLAKKPDDVNLQNGFAVCLNNLAISLHWLGNDAQALGFAKQALAIRQRLSEKSPDRFNLNFATSLNTYANRLGNAGRQEEALGFAEQALAIQRRLSEKSPDRFEPILATLLQNYANRLGEVGRQEEALVHAEQALAIRQRLSEKSPDRFEPILATLLQNYANCLSDIGKQEEALRYAEQALAIYERLAQKIPARYDDNCFGTRCNMLILNWLVDESSCSADKLSALNELPSTLADHKKAKALFCAGFVQACAAKQTTQQLDLFKQSLKLWQAVNKSDQQGLQEYFLAICAYFDQHEPAALNGVDWLASWQAFHQQRQGRLPQWMHALAERLNFQFVQPLTER